jgi:6-pyruvoyl-tetrahydropterin synthase
MNKVVTESAIMLNNVTQIDLAYINHIGSPVGFSANLACLVTGKMDAVERVVIDLSAVKKKIKSLIDDHDTGYDHKLWFIEGFSAGHVTIDKSDADSTVAKNNVLVMTPHVQSSLVHDSVRIIKPLSSAFNFGDPKSVCQAVAVESMSAYLTEELSKVYPDLGINVECSVDFTFDVADRIGKYDVVKQLGNFTYVHGLRNSSSYGCQNIMHGHYSTAAIYFTSHDSTRYQDDCNQLARIARSVIQTTVANRMLIAEQNVASRERDSLTMIYTAGRGAYSLTTDEMSNVALFQDETTVECIADEIERIIVEHLKDDPQLHLDFGIYISEGLCKGSFIRPYSK